MHVWTCGHAFVLGAGNRLVCFGYSYYLLLKIMENVNNSGRILNEDHSPSFFQNSCTGNASKEEKAVGEIPEKVNGDGGSRPRKMISD